LRSTIDAETIAVVSVVVSVAYVRDRPPTFVPPLNRLR